MSNESFLSNLHPCPNCNTPVANIARICHNCGAEQPAYHAEAYRKHLTEQQIEAPAVRAEASDDKDVPLARRQSPFRKLALRLRQQP